jgi:signal transduction histidine kinase
MSATSDDPKIELEELQARRKLLFRQFVEQAHGTEKGNEAIKSSSVFQSVVSSPASGLRWLPMDTLERILRKIGSWPITHWVVRKLLMVKRRRMLKAPEIQQRLEAPEGPILQLCENNLGDCLDALWNRWREAFQRKGVRFEVNIDPSIPTFRFDYMKVQQAVANLLDNALCHAPRGGSVTLNCMPRPNGVEVSVTGALEHDQKILDAYSTVSLSPPQTSEESLAIGLTIAKRLVLAHHGKIWVEASPTGSRYAFLMPMDQG